MTYCQIIAFCFSWNYAAYIDGLALTVCKVRILTTKWCSEQYNIKAKRIMVEKVAVLKISDHALCVDVLISGN